MSKGIVERKEEVVDRLLKREEARLAEVEKKKAEKDRQTAAHEQTNFFTVTFNQAKDDLELKVAEAKLLDRYELLDYFNTIVKDYQKLQKFLADSTMFLPSYDIKVAQDALKTLQESIQNSQDTLLPKKKFAFRSKKKWIESGKDITDHVKSKIDPKELSSDQKELSVNLSGCGFKDLSGQKLEKFSHEVNKKDVGLYRLKDCEVKIFGAPTTILMSGLQNCKILIGPVSTSVFIEDCTNCIFSLACQQLRVHKTVSTVFYLHVVSRTIIEDCEDLKFAPYNWVYESMDKDFDIANINKSINNWQFIDDFNWLVVGVPSPNWTVLEEEEQIQFWN